MIELASILLLLVGLGLMHWSQHIFLGSNNLTYSKLTNLIFFFFIWNSEYLATSVMFLAILHFVKDENQESLTILLKNLVYVMLFAFIFRKVKDVGMQFLLEQNLQNIK